MRVVIVNDGLCYPPTAGNRIRTLNLMLQLARRHDITYLCRGGGNPAESRQASEFLGDHGVRAVIVNHPLPPKAGWRFYARLARNVFSPLPYSVASLNSWRMRGAIAAHAKVNRVDLWQFEWLTYADALRDCRGARTLLMAHNVESLIWQRYYQNEMNLLKRWYIRKQWAKVERLERRLFAEATRVVAVTEEDAARARSLYGVDHIDVVDNGIDRAYFEDVGAPRDPKQILFLGSLDWRPNQDAVRFFLDAIYPQVLARDPSARLCVVGRLPPDWLVQRIKQTPRAELHADVKDVRPFLARAGVLAVPLRIGGGSRLKILEALACGLPVVSTPVGAEGLGLRHGHELFVAEESDFAGAIIECLGEPRRALQTAEQGRRLVLDRFDWGVLADKLEGVWESCFRREGAACVPS